MGDGMGALTLLGESADWLKDAKEVPIRDLRVSAMEAFRSAWAEPANESRHEAMRQSFGRLLEGLRHNHLYPEGAILDRGDSTTAFLPSPETLRKDFEQLQDFLVTNKFGMAEVHVLYVIYLLFSTYYKPEHPAYDQMVEQALGDILMLRLPVYRADNLAPFSSEAQMRYHAVRLLRCMRTLGLLDDGPVGRLTAEDHAETAALLSDEASSGAGDYIQRPYRLPFTILDTASALEANARAHAASRAPLDARSADQLFSRLRRRLKRIGQRQDIGATRRERLFNLGVAACVRAMAHVDAELGQKIYAELRSETHHPRVRHTRMFHLLPNSTERLRFLNFLYTHGQQNPIYYVERFQHHFPGEELRFVRREIGFAIEPKQSD